MLGRGGTGGSAASSRRQLLPFAPLPRPRLGAWVAASSVAIAAEIPALGLSSFWQKPFCALLLLLAQVAAWGRTLLLSLPKGEALRCRGGTDCLSDICPPQGLLCFFAPLRRPLCSVRLSGDASPEQPTGVALGGGIPQQGSARLCSQGPQQTRGSPLTPRPLPGLLPELHPVAQPRGCCVPGSGGYRLSTGISQPVASASQPECTGKL